MTWGEALHTRALQWVIVVFVVIMIILIVIDGRIPKTASAGSCEDLWQAHRNDTLIGYTHSAYIKQCNSDNQQLQQYVNDHR